MWGRGGGGINVQSSGWQWRCWSNKCYSPASHTVGVCRRGARGVCWLVVSIGDDGEQCPVKWMPVELLVSAERRGVGG